MESRDLSSPSLSQAAKAFSEFLSCHYEKVLVEVVDCPDLREWGLAFPGLGGDPSLVEVGGVPFLLDPKFHLNSYSIHDIARKVGTQCFLGAASGDASFVGQNSELMPNWDLEHDINGTQVSLLPLGDEDKTPPYQLKLYSHNRVGFLANLFSSRGEPGQVLHIRVENRIEGTDLITSMLSALLKHFPEQCVGIGGVFQLQQGSFNAHIMPDFKNEVMEDGEEVKEWLRFFEFSGPGATFLSTMISQDPTGGSLNLRPHHTHFFNSVSGQGGHFHEDTLPSKAIYEGYFNIAQQIHRYESASYN